MTVTLVGLQGTVSDTQQATQLPHHSPSVYTLADRAPTAVNGQRAVSIAAGSSLAAYLKRTSDAAEVVTLAPPASGGKWYAITEDRQWSPTNTAVLKADDLAVTNDGSLPSFPPAAAFTAAGALPNQPGTAGSTAGQRMVLALVFVRAADTTTYYYDTRMVVTAAGVLAATTFAALLLNNIRHFRDGALVTVLRHFMPSGGTHVLSRWQRESSYLVPAGVIEGDGANPNVAQTVADDVKAFSVLPGMGTIALPLYNNSRFLNRSNGAEYAFINGAWRPWNWIGVPLNNYGYYIGGATSGDGLTQLDVVNGQCILHLAVYRNGGMGLDAGYFKLIDPFIPNGGTIRTAGYSDFDGNSRTTMAGRLDVGGNIAWDGNNGVALNRWRGIFTWPIAY